MVSIEELEELFEIRDGHLYGKHVSWRRKESNTRVAGKRLGTLTPDGYRTVGFKTKDGKKNYLGLFETIESAKLAIEESKNDF